MKILCLRFSVYKNCAILYLNFYIYSKFEITHDTRGECNTMNRKLAGCAAAAVLCTCLLCRTPAAAVSLEQPSGQTDNLLKAADQASLLPSSMDGQQAGQPITREQMCGLAVRLYASLTDRDYSSLMEQSAARRSVCPYTDTQSADVRQAWLLGLTEEEDGIQFRPDEPANRQQLIAMLYRAMQQSGSAVGVSENEIAETLYSYSDGVSVSDWAQDGMAYFVREGLTSGTGGNMLGSGEPVSAEQAAVLTYRAAAAVHTGRGVSSAQDISSIAMHSGTNAVSWTGCGADYYRVSFYASADFSTAPVLTEQVASAGTGAQEFALPQEIAEQPGVWYWSVDGLDCTGKLVASSGQTAPLTVTAQAEDTESGLYIPDSPVIAQPDIISDTIPDGLAYSGESYSEKVARIFGAGAGYHKYANSTEAESHQVIISVQVWDFDANGNKVTKTKRFQIHEALAATVQQIFGEIYASGEQFPIKSLGGYCWRGNGSSSEHCLGTAIDINWEENYMCTNSGVALTGSHWSPGSDPYSIPADSAVVRIFAKYGFSWGGTWNSKKDYMHFSYFGT